MKSCPTIIRSVKEELDTLISSLIECGIVNDQNFSIIRSFKKNVWDVSFSGADNISIVLRSTNYSNIYKELCDNRSYNVKFLDGGILQCMYRFEADCLIQHRLAYYPSPDLRPFHEDPDTYLYDDLFLDIVNRHIFAFPIRFDFDKTAAQNVEHPMCHLTLGDVKFCRIPVSSALTPRWFFEFILRNFYRTENNDFVKYLTPHRFSFCYTITSEEYNLIHIVIPKLMQS
jgi:hypothetical protein